jgi:hypothetical protein
VGVVEAKPVAQALSPLCPDKGTALLITTVTQAWDARWQKKKKYQHQQHPQQGRPHGGAGIHFPSAS